MVKQIEGEGVKYDQRDTLGALYSYLEYQRSYGTAAPVGKDIPNPQDSRVLIHRKVAALLNVLDVLHNLPEGMFGGSRRS